MKNSLIWLLVLVPLNCLAAGPLDGVWICAVNASGYPTATTYLIATGHSDGTTIFAVPAIIPGQSHYGYSIGTATSTGFIGTTQSGHAVNISGNTTIQNGTYTTMINGRPVPATLACNKVF